MLAPELKARPPASLPPSSYFLRGRDRLRLDQVAARIARYLDRGFVWLDFQDPARDEPTRAPALEGLLGAGHLRVIDDPVRVRGHDPAASGALWSMLRPDEDPTTVQRITDFLGLPEMLQDLLGAVGGEGSTRRAIVMANVERLAGVTALGPAYFRSMNRAFNRAGVTMIATEVGRGASERYGFDFELVPAPPSGARPPHEALVCVRGGVEDCLIFRGFPRELVACRREVGPEGIGPWEGCATHVALRPTIPLRLRSVATGLDYDLPSPVA